MRPLAKNDVDAGAAKAYEEAKRLARTSWMLPAGSALGVSLLTQSGVNAGVFFTAVLAGAFLGGLVCGLQALAAVKRHGRQGLLWPALAGVFISSVLLLFMAIVFFGTVMKAQAEERGAALDSPLAEGRRVDVGGFRLHVRVLGAERQGPTLVFEAGGGQTLDSWRDLPEKAAETSPVIVYERAGLGLSELGPEPRTAHRVAQELRRLLDEIGKDDGPSGPYVLVMHSLGGLLGRIFADLYPNSVAGFVFIDPTTEGMHRSLWTEEGWAQYEAQLEAFTPGERSESLQLRQRLEELEAAQDPPDRPAVVLTARPAISIPPAAREQMEAMGLTEERLHELQEMKTRLHGELAAKLPRGRQIEVPGASHFVHWQAPEKVLEAIGEVVQQAISQTDVEAKSHDS